jgi:Mrp family chromosome partitioning ATPase/capsular polysaccharide biosynthesis protein
MATISTGPAQAAITPHLAPPTAPGGSTPTGSGGAKINVGASLRKHRKVAAVTAAIIVLLGVPLAWLLGTPKYSATAAVYVSPRFMSNLTDGSTLKFDSATQYREYVQQNVKTINRFDIVLEALKKVPEFEAVWIRKGETLERAANRLQGALVIEEVPDTYQITISLEGTKKVGLAEMVNAVAETYLEKAKSEEFYGSDQRVQSLIQDRTRLDKEISEKQARRMTLAQELGVSSFSENDLNPYDRLLVAAKEAQADAQKEAIQAEGLLAEVDQKQRPDAVDALHAYALSEASKDPALTGLLTNLNNRRAQLMASLSGLSPDHPGRRAAERELADIEKERQAANQKAIDSYSKILLDQRAADAYKARRVEQQLTAEVERQASQAAWFTRGYQEGIQLGLEVDQARKAQENLQQRIDYFLLEKSAPGFVRLFSVAREPDQPVKGGRKKLFAIFLVFALLLAVAVPVGIDFVDPRVHSPSQVESLLGFAPISWLMDRDEAGPAFEHEQILRLANRLNQDKLTNHSRIFAFTSVKARGGTSTIVMETARALTSLGVPALAVEANAYRNDPRYSKPNSRGLAEVLTGSAHLHLEVVPGDADRPDRIPVGEIAGGTNLPDIRNLGPVLRNALEAYDLVLVDIPPILASVDAEIVACSADVVVLVIEAGSVTREELRRAAKSLERMSVRAVSALLNKVRLDEPTGLAAVALNEFLTGARTPGPRVFTPWLWR